MDTAYDFIKPEFLNILFFEQRNLVVYPYADLKHLTNLEAFTLGHTLVPLDATSLNDLESVLEYDQTSNYSTNLYLLYNVSKKSIKTVLKMEGVRCIINSKETVPDLANGAAFIFYNKKTQDFVNYEPEDSLELEKELIASSLNPQMLKGKINQVYIHATEIFEEVVGGEEKSAPKVAEIISHYEKKHWPKILAFVENHFGIKVPTDAILKQGRTSQGEH